MRQDSRVRRYDLVDMQRELHDRQRVRRILNYSGSNGEMKPMGRRHSLSIGAVGGGDGVTPFISSVSGSLVHNNTLQINGSGFGSHANYGRGQPFLCTAYIDWTSGLEGGNWVNDNFNPVPSNLRVLSDGNARGGASTHYYQKRNQNQNDNQNLGCINVITSGNPTFMYFSFYYMELGGLMGAHAAGGDKYFRVYFGDDERNFYFGPGPFPNGWLCTTSGELYGHNGRYNGSAAGDVFNPRGVWRQMEVEIAFSGGATMFGSADYLAHWLSRTRLMRRGSQLPSNHIAAEGSDANDHDQWVDATNNRNGHSVGDLGSLLKAESPADASMCFANAYHSETPARVMIGTNPTYTANTALEVQIPTGWSPNQLEVTLQRGPLTLSGSYLFVKNENNLVNATGFPL